MTNPVNMPSNVSIGNISIRQYNGLYSLNDLHKASGGNASQRPVTFLVSTKPRR